MENKFYRIALIGGCEGLQKDIQEYITSRNDEFFLFKDLTVFQQKNNDLKIDLIIVHVQVPKNSDIECLKKIQTVEKNTRIIIISDKPSKHYDEIFWDKNSIYFIVLPKDQNYLKKIGHAPFISRLREKTNFHDQIYNSIKQGVAV